MLPVQKNISQKVPQLAPHGNAAAAHFGKFLAMKRRSDFVGYCQLRRRVLDETAAVNLDDETLESELNQLIEQPTSDLLNGNSYF